MSQPASSCAVNERGAVGRGSDVAMLKPSGLEAQEALRCHRAVKFRARLLGRHSVKRSDLDFLF